MLNHDIPQLSMSSKLYIMLSCEDVVINVCYDTHTAFLKLRMYFYSQNQELFYKCTSWKYYFFVHKTLDTL